MLKSRAGQRGQHNVSLRHRAAGAGRRHKCTATAAVASFQARGRRGRRGRSASRLALDAPGASLPGRHRRPCSWLRSAPWEARVKRPALSISQDSCGGLGSERMEAFSASLVGLLEGRIGGPVAFPRCMFQGSFVRHAMAALCLRGSRRPTRGPHS